MKQTHTKNGRNAFAIVSLLLTIILLTGFAPMAQNGQNDIEPLTLDFDKISESVAESISLKYEKRLNALETENIELKAAILALTERIAKLESMTNLPTVTPMPEGTLGPTPTLTRTPNPSGYDCEIFLASPYYFGEFSRGAEFNFTIEITNTGTKPWGNEVMMEWISGLKAEKTPMYAYALPKSEVAVNETITYTIVMIAPEETSPDGRFTANYALTNGTEKFCEFEYNIYVP